MTVRLEEHMRKYASPQTPYERVVCEVWRSWRGFPFGFGHHYTPFDEMHEGDIKGEAYSPNRKMVAADIGL